MTATAPELADIPTAELAQWPAMMRAAAKPESVNQRGLDRIAAEIAIVEAELTRRAAEAA